MVQCYATRRTRRRSRYAKRGAPTAQLIVNENLILEIVRPGTGDPVAEGEVGEIVVTSFNPDYPMIRLATGDLFGAVLPGVSPCGRTNMRIKGWMGRADQTAKVKACSFIPQQIAGGRRAAILNRRGCASVIGREAEQDTMTLLAECAVVRRRAGRDAVAATLQSVHQAQRRGRAGRGRARCPTTAR